MDVTKIGTIGSGEFNRYPRSGSPYSDIHDQEVLDSEIATTISSDMRIFDFPMDFHPSLMEIFLM